MKAVLVWSLGLGLAVACGGQVQGINGSGCPSAPPDYEQACASPSTQCSYTVTACADTQQTETCSCGDDSKWRCGGLECDAGPPAEVCPTSYGPDMPCFENGLKCNVEGTFCGAATTVPCTCDGAQFVCEVPNCPAEVCPPPATVSQGFSCDLPPGVQCAGAFLCGGPSTCTCSGMQWWCDGPCDAGGSD